MSEVREPSGVSAVSAGTRPRIAAVYHRPIDAAYHGGSIHFRGFVEGLRTWLQVEVVAPGERSSTGSDTGHSHDEPQLVGFRYLVASLASQVRFVVRELRRPRASRARAVVAFDIYGAGFATVWSAVSSVPLVYYPQDSNRDFGRNWSSTRYKGGVLMRVTRYPLEALSLRRSWLVVCPSAAVEHAIVASGVDSARVRLCTLKRSVPVEDPRASASWRSRLGLGGRIAVVFVGSFQYAPNVRSFEFLRDRVAPALLSSDPDVVVLVAGLDSESHVGDEAPNFRVLGTLPDLDGLLFACSVGLAPSDVSGGTSGKIVDYVLHGLQVVASPQAAQGIEALPSIAVVSLEQFGEGVRRACALIRGRPGPDGRPTPDPQFVARYTDADDLRRIAEEIAAHVTQ